MIQVTFTPGTSAQAALVGQLMAQYLALDEQPQEPVRTTSGLIASAQEEAAAPVVKRVRKPAAVAQDSASAIGTPAEDPNAAAEPSVQEAPAASTVSSTEPELSRETVRAKLTEVSKAGKATEVKALLAALGVANLTAVPKEAYAKLMADAAAL
jgi:hypothetical protein